MYMHYTLGEDRLLMKQVRHHSKPRTGAQVFLQLSTKNLTINLLSEASD